MLFYKAPTGICTYTGALPTLLELPFGGEQYKNVMAAGTSSKYYFFGNGKESNVLFVYDTKNGLLHKEDALGIGSTMVSHKGNVYATASLPNEHSQLEKMLISLNDNGEIKHQKYEKRVPWFAETGIIGLSLPDKKYITALDIRLSLPVGSTVSILIQYDSAGEWEHVHTLTGKSTRSFNLPIRVKRCDHLRMRISGKGDAKVYSITKTVEQGSDV